ncbi:hypothetical protein D3C87_1053090 [compost metagenome]
MGKVICGLAALGMGAFLVRNKGNKAIDDKIARNQKIRQDIIAREAAERRSNV